ncbi:hypothetical protein PMQ77_08685 [Bifidobacterium longum]|nr:hypothetical protein [Bifidobacterium longum]MDB6701910.1 hypothetical protein [Bifidobacterium longum]MDB6703825.1 hypothetical protein [Bifidobacterium longum]
MNHGRTGRARGGGGEPVEGAGHDRGLAISIALASIPFAAFAIGLILNAASPRVRTQFMKNYE